MSMEPIATALERVASVLRKRPSAAVSDDAPAVARWDGGLRVTARHPAGTEVATDMPAELGGAGESASPGWLVRAGAASCAVTRIVMAAAAEGVALESVDATMSSRSDVRGLLGMQDADGAAVFPGPSNLRLEVRVSAPGVPRATIERLVEESCRCSPVGAALQAALPVQVELHVAGP
jgi:uncharacterized OsmC-like protein